MSPLNKSSTKSDKDTLPASGPGLCVSFTDRPVGGLLLPNNAVGMGTVAQGMCVIMVLEK